MLGKTHMAVGVASSLLLLRPEALPELVLGTGIAAVGAVISDIDVGTSGSRKDANKIVALLAASIAMVVAAEYVWNIGIYSKLLMRYSSDTRLYGSVIAFIAISIFGMMTPHRSFMHSILSLFLLGSCVEVFLPLMVPYFGIAYISHLSLDLLNKKGEKLLYPLGKGFCLRMCSSKGLVNKILFGIGMFVSVSLIIFYAAMILKH